MTTHNSIVEEHFLLHNKFAVDLYENYAKDLPIVDYHNHLSPKDIAEDTQFSSISAVWLKGDHYKWRAMRALGIQEHYITGDASDKEKFFKWAETVPYTIRNPLFHWSHLELHRYFGISELLSPTTAEKIYSQTNELLSQTSHSTRGLLKQMNVESACTTDDPVDDLSYHKTITSASKNLKVLPTFRPDKAYAVENTTEFLAYVNQLSAVCNIHIDSYDKLLEALQSRIDYFHNAGCRLADHGLEQLYYFEKTDFKITELFQKLMQKKPLTKKETHFFKFKTLIFLCKCYHKKNWVQQFHLGAIRNNNKRLLTSLGPDTGFDSIGDYTQATALSGFLNMLDTTDQLAKTILYNLNPAHNEVFATMAGNFNDGSTKGKVQYGAAWWFLDQKNGMEKHLNTLSSLGMLSCFVGMLTDSRSFLSFPRHEYFRRILCNLIGQDVEKGDLPKDEKWLGKIVSDICYNNAKAYFDF